MVDRVDLGHLRASTTIGILIAESITILAPEDPLGPHLARDAEPLETFRRRVEGSVITVMPVHLVQSMVAACRLDRIVEGTGTVLLDRDQQGRSRGARVAYPSLSDGSP